MYVGLVFNGGTAVLKSETGSLSCAISLWPGANFIDILINEPVFLTSVFDLDFTSTASCDLPGAYGLLKN